MGKGIEKRTPAEVLALCKANGVRFVDYRFTDLLGTLQHITSTIEEFDLKTFEGGKGFDGSSIRGFKSIHESDMLLMPDPHTAYIDPFYQHPTLVINCDIADPVNRKPYDRDARYIAKKAEAYLAKTGIAEISYWGPELEFFVFDSMRFAQNQNSGYYYLESNEGVWNTGLERAVDGSPNLAYRIRNKEGYFPTAPTDTYQDFRSEVLQTLVDLGIRMEVHHHEVATGGQGEFDVRYNTLVTQADTVGLIKYVARNVARKHGKVLTFMPKPLFGDNGTGMHTHQSLWKAKKNLFFDPKSDYAGISQTCKYYIGGLLKHAHAILAFGAPGTNSYRRLVPGFEAPVNLAYSARNRSACVRIPVYANDEKAKRIEFRPPDATCNPYLAFSAMLMAGIDGITNKIDPGKSLDADIYELPPEELKKIRTVPGSLEQAIGALEQDNDFLTRGGVFTKDLIETYIDYKRKKEIDPMRLRPHPYEFFLYADA
ncbi:MAG: type I glutamate--ammonia ligase [Chloroflexi bacterium]|nr:type I glutamate--ammonia ligase [Chloroflexota bacterium]